MSDVDAQLDKIEGNIADLKRKVQARGAGRQGNSKFTLIVDGREYEGWESIRVTRGLERATADFALSVSEKWAGLDDIWHILPGLSCRIEIDGDLVLTGWVDKFQPSYDGTSHTVSVTGRSKTCDFVDSSVTQKGGEFKGLTLKQIGEVLAKPFGITVVAEVEGEAVPEVQVQQSETCFQLLERLVRLQELLITDNEKGELVLCRVGDKRASTSLVEGENILSGQADLDHSERFSEYIVKAQRAGNKTNDDAWSGVETLSLETDAHGHQILSADTAREQWRLRMLALQQSPPDALATRAAVPRADEDDDDDDDDDDADTDTETDRKASVISEVHATVKDPEIKRHRPKVIIAESEADDAKAEQRADWEMRRRIAKSLTASVTVVGWRQQGGELWASNLTVSIRSPWLALDRELVVSEVEFTYDTSGEITKLSLTLPDAFLPEKVRKAKKAKKGKGKGTGDPWAGVA